MNNEIISQILDFCEKERRNVKGVPKTNQEYGFKLAVMTLTSKLEYLLIKNKEIK